MNQRRQEGLRSEALVTSLSRALDSNDRTLFDMLTRASVAPGLRANSELAMGFADELARLAHPRSIALLREMAETDAKPHSPEEFLLIAAAHGLVACIRAGRDVRAAWEELRELADDERAIVRAAVADAIGTMLVRNASASVFVAEADSWMDEFFPAAVALETLTAKHVVQQIEDPAAMIELLDRGVSMIEHATRASERKPGRRRLLDVLPGAIAACAGALHGGQEWITARAQIKHPDLRAAFEKAIALMGRKGAHTADLEAVVKSLDASQKPRRDPLTDFGPSRKRSKKHRGRAR